jgi:drug/metabolite transporter (DMT)-like permease/methyl-accepting chemotaxis protein
VDEVRRRLQPYLFILLAVLLQGLSPVLTKLLMDWDGLSASTVVAARYGLAVLFLLPFGIRRPDVGSPYGPPRRRDWVALIGVGGFGSAIGTLLFTQALGMAPAGVVNALSKTAPIFVAFLAYYALRERISSLRFTLVFVMVAADVLIGLGEFRAAPAAQVGARLAGDAFALLAGLSRALAEILSKGCLHRFRPSTVALSRFGVGLVVGAVACTAAGGWGELARLSARGWIVLVVLASVGTSVSMAVYLRGLAEAQAHVAVSLRLLGSIVTVGFAWSILGERLQPLHFAGIAILLGAAYVIVSRAARREAVPSAALSEPWTPAMPKLSLKLKVATLIVAVVFTTMFASSTLSIRHTEGVVRREIRVLMAQMAANIAQLQAVPDTPRLTTTSQYIDRLVRQDIVGPAYSVRIIFIAVLDQRGHVTAFATNPLQLTLADTSGLAYRRGDRSAVQRLVRMALSGELDRTSDVVTVRAVSERDGREVPLVVLGCRRSLARRAEEEVRNRAVLLTFIFVLLGMAVAIQVAGGITRPLEHLARAMRRVRAGNLGVIVVPEGNDEIQDLAKAFNDMVDGLRAQSVHDRAFGDYLGRAVLRSLPPGQAETGRQTVTALSFGIRDGDLPTGRDAVEAVNECAGRVIDAVSQYDGAIDSQLGPGIIGVWGAAEEEQDDALRAVMAAVTIAQDVRDLNEHRADDGKPPLPVTIAVSRGEAGVGPAGVLEGDLRRLGELAGRCGLRAGNAARVLISAATHEEVAAHVRALPLPASVEGPGGGSCLLVVGFEGEPPLYSVDELTAMGLGDAACDEERGVAEWEP